MIDTPSGFPTARQGLLHWAGPALLTALAYGVVGRLTLLLAVGPGLGTPLFPSAGIALAAVLTWGPRALPGVVLGALAVNLAPYPLPTQLSGLALLPPVASSLGAALQAAVGAWLVRRRLPGPLVLGEPRDVAWFFGLGGVLACGVNTTLSIASLRWAGVLPPGDTAIVAWTWWAGDTLGVLIGAPIVLTIIGRPRAAWATRRLMLGLPMLVTTLLMALASVLVARWDTQRSHSVFERDATAAAAAVESNLRQSVLALEAARGLFIGSADVTASEFRRAMQPWQALPIQLQALGYAERVPRSRVPEFEREVADALQQPYRVFDRRDDGAAPPSAGDAEVLAIRYIEPLAANRRALGLNSLSVPAARVALQRAIASDTPSASTGFRLTQEPGDQTGVVIYRALYNGEPEADQRAPALRAAVFVTLRMQQSVDASMHAAPAYLQGCLVDADAAAVRRRLAGPVGCELAAPAALHHERRIALGGQQWLMRLDADMGSVRDAGHGNAWLFSAVGLLAAALLSALLLIVTGRTRRIEAAVAERTADLQREVAERQRTESALRESEQRLRNIFDHAPIGILYADLEGRIRSANPRLREMLGYAEDALARASIAELAHADDRADIARNLAWLLAGEQPEVPQRCRLQRQDGTPLWVRMDWSVLRSADGQPLRLVVVVEDITEHLRREEAEAGRQAAESANRAKSEFLSRMSHELRTPLNAMLGFAQLLDLDRRQPLATHQKGWVGQILQAGWHLLEMINDTLDLSRIEAGMLRLTLAPVPLQPLVQHCLAMVAGAAARRQIVLAVTIAPDTPLALADETRLKQVLTNLLTNAVKYNVDGGRVEVQTRRLDGQRLQVRVLDTGLGLSDSQMADLFQPFNRLGRELSDTEGTGIGLVISRRLAELMGGELQAERSDGPGATFVLTLPSAAADAPDSVAGALVEDGGSRYHQRLVHYIEDNETNVEVMRGMLAQRPQVTLAVSALGLDGLAAVRQRRPDLILLDMHLPDVDGLELLRQLQRDPQCADIPVLVLSADATAARIEEALAAGARHYLTKPLNLGEFLGVLDDLLGNMDTRYG